MYTRVIETRGLSKIYSRGLYALQDLTLSVAKGEFVFLTGPSGAGKSTLLRLLLMQDRPTDGEIAVNGHDLSTLKRREIQEYRRGIGFIFQDFKLIPTRTVLENISFVSEVLGVPPAQQRRRAFQVLKWVGLQHRMNAFPASICPVGNSSALPSPGRWSTTRRSSSPTSPPVTSIPTCRWRS